MIHTVNESTAAENIINSEMALLAPKEYFTGTFIVRLLPCGEFGCFLLKPSANDEYNESVIDRFSNQYLVYKIGIIPS